MKKRVLAMLLALVMACSFVACGELDDSEDLDTGRPQNKVLPTDSGTAPTEEMMTDRDIYRQFLDGEIKAALEPDRYSLSYICVEYDYKTGKTTYLFPDQTVISFDDLKSAVAASAGWGASDMTVSYAVMKTLSGKEVLAILFDSVGIDGPGVGSGHALFLFAAKDERLAMTYAYDSWSRSRVTINENLIFTGAGSSGAGDSASWSLFVDETGHAQSIYDCRYLFDAWIAMYDWEFSGENTDWSDGCAISLLSTAGGGYFSCKTSGKENSAKLNAFLQRLKDEGMREISDVEAQIHAAFQDCGIDPRRITPFYDWISLDYGEPDAGTTTVKTGTVKVNTNLIIRSGPGSNYAEEGFMPNGTKVTISEIRTVDGVDWGRIPAGWICLTYVVLD